MSIYLPTFENNALKSGKPTNYFTLIRIIILLTPIFVSLFWSITLMGDKSKWSKPRQFLSWFMLLTAVIFSAHFLYFAPLPNLYRLVDVPLQWLGLTIFPLYHIYFRLLTVDEEFSLKTHAKYLVIPALVALGYGIAVRFAPADQYSAWLFNNTNGYTYRSVRFLILMRTAIRITFFVSLILSLIGNDWLIRKYGEHAEQFYSDIQEAKQTNAKNINYTIMIMGIACMGILSIGRGLLGQMDWLIYLGWTMFAVLLFMIGNSGMRQKMINPTIVPEYNEDVSIQPIEISNKEQEEFLRTIVDQFTHHKIYLNSNLNIADVVKRVGTNRSYVSLIINQHSNQNFCAFVNDFRIKELKRVMSENLECTNEDFAHRCGFGSVNSLKRAIFTRTGMSFKDFKQQTLCTSIQ